jgi:tRNA-dihydrouridine synthase
MHIPVFGNGDVASPELAKAMRDKYGLDGCMIGRASIGYPWVFREIKHYLATGQKLEEPSLEERLEAVRNHVTWSCDWKGEKLGILEMRRHYTNYFKGFDGIKPFRTNLVSANTQAEVFEILTNIENHFLSII